MRDPTHRGWRSNAGAVACRATRAVGLLAFAVFVRAEPLHAQGLVSWPEDDACRERYTESLDGYPAYINCLVSKMPALDSANRHAFGERYDPAQYGKCRVATQPRDTSCEPYRLRRRRQPEYWPNAGKVPPVKWPEAPKASVYRKGMKPKEYFDALCKAEAGEFIYRTVEGVEGIYQVRPRLRANDYELRDRYVLEDPYGYSNAEATKPQDHLVQPPRGRFQYLEVHNSHADSSMAYLRFYRGDPVPKSTQTMERGPDGNYIGKVVPYVVSSKKAEQLTSRYGYTWRGITRQRDRENSIAGGELVIVDLQTNEILGLRRGFAMTRTKNSPHGPNWEVSSECPPHVMGSGSYRFVRKVLNPFE